MSGLIIDKQQEAIQTAVSGHNFILIGQPGTGKSYTIGKIYEQLKVQGKQVFLTCTTGIACTNFGVQAETIHRWAGLEDGRYTSIELCNLIKNSPKYSRILQNIITADVLIIDEISMLSAKLFQQLCDICSIKDSTKLFGGIQIIVSGDFLQLAPVPNRNYNDEGAMCFTCPLFEKVLPHKVVLNRVVRQDNERFINVIHEVSKGIVSPESISYIKTLDRPLPIGNEVMLFSNNDLVNVYNRRQILNGPGVIREFVSEDSGDVRMLIKSTAPPRLWLKEGCPVILIRNLNNKLVNGLRGKVVDFEDTSPIVHFPSINCTTKVEKVSFSVFNPDKNMTVATRVQVPLKLAYAITIHKSQGMTLDRVTVDCQQIFKPGQLGVAMGRVRTPDGLRIVNFHPSVCLSHPEEIYAFITQTSRALDCDLSCCRHHKRTFEERQDILITGEDEDSEMIDMEDDEFDEELDRIIAEINLGETDISTDFQMPEGFNINTILTECIFDNPLTPIQKEMNDAISQMINGDHVKLNEFCQNEFKSIGKLVDDMNICEPAPVKSETMTEFYRQCHIHQTSDSYRIACAMLFQPFNNIHSHICFKITTAVRNFLLKEKSKLFPVSSSQSSSRTVTDASKARIRYVGGYCLSKTTQKYLRLQRSRMYLLSPEKQLEFDDAAEKLNILNSLREEENYLKTVTSAPNSLIDVTRKQNLNRGLYHISDNLFEFFVHLSEKCLSLLNEENFQLHGENLHTYCLAELLKCSTLIEKFSSVVRDRKCTSVLFRDVHDTPTLLLHCLFEEIAQSFFMVMFNQFRKDKLQSFSVAKTMAHRKQIQVKKQKKESSSVKTVTFSTIQNDVTENRAMSHSIITGLVLSKVDVFNVMTKVQIQQLLRAYNVKFKSSSNKSILIKDLENAILNCASMPNPTVLDKHEHSQSSNVENVVHDFQEPELPTTSVSRLSTAGKQPTDSSEHSAPQPSTSSAQGDSEVHPSTSVTGEGMPPQPFTSYPMEDSDNDDLCKVCFKGEIGTDWICCTSCGGWLHRTCAKIKSNIEWKKISRPNAKFFCSECS